MKISFSATNPCHLFPLAREVAKLDALGCYYSGYPAWKLRNAEGMHLRTHSLRTNVVYGLLKYAPGGLRPSDRTLFLWQDQGFDRWAGRHLERCDFIHGMPGQCRDTFRAARRLGVRTVLNHATGPVRDWVRIMGPEYARIGQRLTDVCPYDDAYFAREDEEYALADWHCAASSVVREQLAARGIPRERIMVVPYGAEPDIFHADDTPPPTDFRIIFAGQLGLRKGLRTMLEALKLGGSPDWRVDFYGTVADEAEPDLDAFRGSTPLHFFGPVAQPVLAKALRGGSVLLLPSIEEGFGLVVPQALSCGLPVIVSDAVGGQDLVRHRENGSIFPAGDPAALLEELHWWAENPRRVREAHDWSGPARAMLDASTAALK